MEAEGQHRGKVVDAMRRPLLTWALTMLLLAGCWDQREISELVLVRGVAIDRTDAGMVRVTIQSNRLSATSQTGAGGMGGAPEQPSVHTASAEGPSIFEAIRNLALHSSRRIMWAHNQLIIIGRSQAEHGVSEIVDFFTRNPELRYRALVTLAEGEAAVLLTRPTGLETLPSDSIEKTFRYATFIGLAHRVDMKEFAESYLSGENSVILPTLKQVPQIAAGAAATVEAPMEVQVSGMSVFRGQKLAALLTPEESRGVLMAQERTRRIVLSVPCPGGRGLVVAELVGREAQIRVSPGPGTQVTATVEVNVQAALSTVTCTVDILDSRTLGKIEGSIAAALEKDLEAAVHRTMETGTDPIGVGRYIRAFLPEQWRRLKQEWPERIKSVKFTTRVKASVVGSEVTVSPPIPGEESGGHD